MPKILREISGRNLAKLLNKYGYVIARQTGSRIRLTSNFMNKEYHITKPDHDSIKIGSLSKIVKDVANYLEIEKQLVINKIFS